MIALWIVLGLVGLLAGLALFASVYPRRSLVLIGLLPGGLSFALLAAPGAFWWLAGLDAVLVLVAIGDLVTLPRRGAFSAERRSGTIASLGKPHRVELILTNQSDHEPLVSIRDGVPEVLVPDTNRLTTRLKPKARLAFHYSLRPRRRGAFTLSTVYLLAQSRWRLWQRMMTCPAHSQLNVYPDMRQLSEYAILARTNRLSLMGVRRTRRIGEDNEFERLRDYQLDDNYKHIDWRSTAKRNKLTVRDFQANQSQRIIFLIDCGRMMTGQASGLSLLDHALNAMLMLSFVALRQGDQVGLICFSDQIHGFVPPRGGLRQTNRLLHASFDRFPKMVESRYDEAFLYLGSHCRRRALVVLMTNVIDDVNAQQIQQYLARLAGRHLPLGVLLRDHRLFEAIETDRGNESELFRASAAANILAWRHQVLRDLAAQGVLLLDEFPENLTAPLVNRYLSIKARHLL